MLSYFSRLGSGKNFAPLYYVRSLWSYFMPRALHRWFCERDLRGLDCRADYEYIISRVNYYNKLDENRVLNPQNRFRLSELRLKNSKIFGSRYLFDASAAFAAFDPDLYFEPLFGDITHVPETPNIVKSRPIQGDVRNSVVLKLNATRHFIFLDDKIPFREK